MIKIPQLIFITAAPFAIMGLFSVYVRPGWATDVVLALQGRSDKYDPTDDVVWSNAAYPLAAFGAWYSLPEMAFVWGTGVFLAVGSAAYHSTYERWAQRFDVAAIFAYLGATLGAVLSPWTVWAWALVPIAAAAYSYWTWEINSHYHVPAWALAIIVALWFHVQWAALWAAAPVLVGVGIDQFIGGGNSDHWAHSAWHLGGAGSVAWVLYLI